MKRGQFEELLLRRCVCWHVAHGPSPQWRRFRRDRSGHAAAACSTLLIRG